MKNILFTSLVGSRARGVSTATSDFDYVGAFIASRQEIGGFGWKASSETETDASPEGDDHTFHEIRKWLTLASKSNPSIVEPLFSPEISISSSDGYQALEVSRGLLSTNTMRNASIGMMRSQMHRFFEDNRNHPKLIQSALYISNTAINLLRDGITSIRIEDAQQHYEFPLMSEDDILSTLENKILEIRNCTSALADEPDWDSAIEFLNHIRTKY